MKIKVHKTQLAGDQLAGKRCFGVGLLFAIFYSIAVLMALELIFLYL